jgi:hypothetical protein
MVGLRRRRRPARGLLSTLLLGNLPPGMRFALESRTHTVFMIVTIAALIGTGIISIRWEEARPEVEFHEERAWAVGTRVVDRFRDQAWFDRVEAENQGWLDIDFEDQVSEWSHDHEHYVTRLPSPGWTPPSISRAERLTVAEREEFRDFDETTPRSETRVGSLEAPDGRGSWR